MKLRMILLMPMLVMSMIACASQDVPELAHDQDTVKAMRQHLYDIKVNYACGRARASTFFCAMPLLVANSLTYLVAPDHCAHANVVFVPSALALGAYIGKNMAAGFPKFPWIIARKEQFKKDHCLDDKQYADLAQQCDAAAAHWTKKAHPLLYPLFG